MSKSSLAGQGEEVHRDHREYDKQNQVSLLLASVGVALLPNTRCFSRGRAFLLGWEV